VELIDPKKRVKNRVGQMFFSKVRNVLTFLYILLKRTLHSLTFFAKDLWVLYVLLRSLQENVAFSTFFYVLCKRMQRSLRSFMFFRKERKRTQHSFGFHKSPKMTKKGLFGFKSG